MFFCSRTYELIWLFIIAFGNNVSICIKCMLVVFGGTHVIFAIKLVFCSFIVFFSLNPILRVGGLVWNSISSNGTHALCSHTFIAGQIDWVS